jgi:hypothetical protein
MIITNKESSIGIIDIRKIIINELNKHNDYICFYDVSFKDGSHRISDDGNTLFDIDPDLKEPTKEIVEILKRYGLCCENREIFTFVEKDELESKEKEFEKALTEINNLYK